MKTKVNGKKDNDVVKEESSKIDVIKNLLFGENITTYEQEFEDIKTDVLKKKAELNDLIDSTRKELDAAIDSLSTDINIRITSLEDKFNETSENLNEKKLDKKLLGSLFIKLGTKLNS